MPNDTFERKRIFVIEKGSIAKPLADAATDALLQKFPQIKPDWVLEFIFLDDKHNTVRVRTPDFISKSLKVVTKEMADGKLNDKIGAWLNRLEIEEIL